MCRIFDKLSKPLRITLKKRRQKETLRQYTQKEALVAYMKSTAKLSANLILKRDAVAKMNAEKIRNGTE